MTSLKQRMSNILVQLKNIISQIQTDKLENEQYVLDFVDEVNALSVVI